MVANALKLIVAGAVTLQVLVLTLFTKFKVAAWLTVMLPVFHAAVFDQVPVPAKNTGPKFLPPEVIVLVPEPMK